MPLHVGGRKYYAASSSAPTSPAPTEGDEYYDTTEDKLKVYDNCLARRITEDYMSPIYVGNRRIIGTQSSDPTGLGVNDEGSVYYNSTDDKLRALGWICLG